MNNRLWNCKNPYQGNAKKVLCVCSAGLLRSPSTANVLHREFGYNTRSCGVDAGHALISIDEVLAHWADEIVCMDEYQKTKVLSIMKELEGNFDMNKSIVVLDIPDKYSYMDEELQELILERYKESLI